MAKDKVVEKEEGNELADLLKAQSVLAAFLKGESLANGTKILGIFTRNDPFGAYKQVMSSLSAAEACILQIESSLRGKFRKLERDITLREIRGKDSALSISSRDLLNKAHDRTVEEINKEGGVVRVINKLIEITGEAYKRAVASRNPRDPQSIAELKQVEQKLPGIIKVAQSLSILAR